MSRSYKKTPITKDGSTWHKRQANKRVRRFKGDLANKGTGFRRLYDQYSLCDWKWHETLPQALDRAKDIAVWLDHVFPYSKLNHDYDEKKEIHSWKKFHYWK